MRKTGLFIFTLCTALLLALTGCGEQPGANGRGAASNYRIAISQYMEHPSLDATREGFLAALADAGIVEGDNLDVSLDFAQGDSTNNLSIAQKIASETHDLVLGIATPSALAVVNNIQDTPVLFAAVTDPLTARIVSNLERPGGNVTGASDTNTGAIRQLMDFIAAHFPDVQTVGLVINEGEENAVVMAQVAEEALAVHGLSLIRAAASNSSEVKQAAESLIGRADALYVTLDNSVISAVGSIIQVANENKLPFFSSDRDTVEAGAFATFGFRYYDHGYQVGLMAVDILQNGKEPGEIEVTIPDKIDLIMNLQAAEAQGIEVTDAMRDEVVDKESNIIE